MKEVGRRLDTQAERIKEQTTQIGKSASNAFNAAASSIETKSKVEGMSDLLHLWHKEDREDRNSMWARIEKLEQFKYKIMGGAAAVSIIIGVLFKVL